MSGVRYQIRTPSGFFVRGMSDVGIAPLWRRYERVMNKSQADLEAAGYSVWKISGPGNNRKYEPAS